MKLNRTLTASLSLLMSVWAMGEIPSNYYAGLEGLKKADLKAAAKAAAKKGKKTISYGDDTWDAFKQTDTKMYNGRLIWWDMYSNNIVYADNGGHAGMNIEHSVANSWWGGSKNDAYKDLFHLNPSDATANNRKSNFPLGIVVDVTWENGVTFVGHPAPGASGGAKNVYEPADQYKGDFARAFMYMFTIYDDINWSSTQEDRNYMFDGSSYPSLRPWAYELLLEWNRLDPVDEKEYNRNEAIYKIQKNRNPFIDYPQLGEYIWGSKTNEAFYAADQEGYDPGDTPVTPPVDPNPPVDPIDPPTVTGTWERVVASNMVEESKDYIIVAPSNEYAMSYTLNGKFITPTERMISMSQEDYSVTTVPSDAAIVRLEKLAGNGWAIRVYDQKGDFKGYICSKTAKTITFTDTLEEGTTCTILANQAETKITFGAAGDLQYNASSPRFLTYTSTGQQDIFLYRKVENGAGVETVVVPEEDAPVYDLFGRQMDPENLAPGIYIRAGKKILVR